MAMLLPSFNFIGGKERMKLLRNFYLTKVKNKKIYNNKRNSEVII